MLRVGMPVVIALPPERFAADRDFAALRESRARAGARLEDLLVGLVGVNARYRIIRLYADDRADLARRDGAGEATLRNFPVKYLVPAWQNPQLSLVPPPDDHAAATSPPADDLDPEAISRSPLK